MVDRGDSDHQIVSRLYNDEYENWDDELICVVSNASDDRVFGPTFVDANKSKEEVQQEVLNIITWGKNNDYCSRL